jgi:DNA-binding NarL/FixJ family response regulator
MVAVAIFSADPVLRCSLEQLPRDDPAVTLVGIVDHPSGLVKLLNQNQVDVVLMDIPTGAQLNEWQGFHNNRVALMILIDVAEAGDTVEALNAGAQAILRRSASRNEIVTAIRAVIGGLVVLQPEILTTWLDETTLADGSLDNIGSERARLTRRELEVLACLKQSNRPSVGYFVPHGEVSRRRYSCQAQCRQSNRSGDEGRPIRSRHALNTSNSRRMKPSRGSSITLSKARPAS